MKRKFVLFLSFISLVFMGAMLTNCGGSSSNSGGGGNGGGPYNVVGNWQTTLSTSGESVLFVGVINSQGQALLFGDVVPNMEDTEYVGDTWELPTITGASSFSGMTSMYAALGTQLPGGGAVDTISTGYGKLRHFNYRQEFKRQLHSRCLFSVDWFGYSVFRQDKRVF